MEEKEDEKCACCFLEEPLLDRLHSGKRAFLASWRDVTQTPFIFFLDSYPMYLHSPPVKTSWWMQSRPPCAGLHKGLDGLGLAWFFHMAAVTDESPAGARKGVCNCIMTPNRLHAFRSSQCRQRTASPSVWSLRRNGNDSAVLPQAEDFKML